MHARPSRGCAQKDDAGKEGKEGKEGKNLAEALGKARFQGQDWALRSHRVLL